MGRVSQLSQMIPQGPNRHCEVVRKHDRHSNEDTDGSWCDGVPRLEAFIELTIRVPMTSFMGDLKEDHQVVMGWLADEGIGIIVDEVGETARTCIRVRTSDGIDRVYPLVNRKAQV